MVGETPVSVNASVATVVAKKPGDEIGKLIQPLLVKDLSQGLNLDHLRLTGLYKIYEGIIDHREAIPVIAKKLGFNDLVPDNKYAKGNFQVPLGRDPRFVFERLVWGFDGDTHMHFPIALTTLLTIVGLGMDEGKGRVVLDSIFSREARYNFRHLNDCAFHVSPEQWFKDTFLPGWVNQAMGLHKKSFRKA